MTKSQRPWYVYILQCSDGKFYAGVTTDINERLKTHQEGRGSYFTRCRLPVKVVYSEPHDSQSSARKREMQIKKWGKRNKQELVDGYAGFPH